MKSKYNPILLEAMAKTTLAAKKTDLRYLELVLKVSMITGLAVKTVEAKIVELSHGGVTA